MKWQTQNMLFHLDYPKDARCLPENRRNMISPHVVCFKKFFFLFSSEVIPRPQENPHFLICIDVINIDEWFKWK